MNARVSRAVLPRATASLSLGQAVAGVSKDPMKQANNRFQRNMISSPKVKDNRAHLFSQGHRFLLVHWRAGVIEPAMLLVVVQFAECQDTQTVGQFHAL